MRKLRLAIDGCYPSFFETDLVVRILHGLCVVEPVPRSLAHDLLIRGPFSDGNRKRRLVNRALRLQSRLRPMAGGAGPISLHVSAENPGGTDYQNFADSGCDFGLGHEFRLGDSSFYRMPHWWNYIDFSSVGIASPKQWVRLGEPIQEAELMRPVVLNAAGLEAAVFVVSELNTERRFLYEQCRNALPIHGYGRAFDRGVKNHNCSFFTKRQLLRGFRFSFCPENALYPGYYTEKIPESFVCGTIPISYADQHVSRDFNPGAFINLAEFLPDGVEKGLLEALNSAERMQALRSTPLRSAMVDIEGLRSFLEKVLDAAFSS